VVGKYTNNVRNERHWRQYVRTNKITAITKWNRLYDSNNS
jgi:hypothetical protein